MSKAEERALKAYPIKMDAGIFGSYDLNLNKRTIYQQGYEQAEKDNELTWDDIREIYCTTLNLKQHLGASVFGEPLYQEVLKLFKDYKERKEK